ncbi:MAG: phosphatase PAP2 family protein [Spongiibacteraceae bacterium]
MTPANELLTLSAASPEQWAQWCVLHGAWLLAAANALTLIVVYYGWRVARVESRTRVVMLIVIPVLALTLFIWLAQMHIIATVMTRFDFALAAELRNTLRLDVLKVWVAITHLGDGFTRAVMGVAMAVVLFRRRSPWCGAWICAVAGIGLLNHGLKIIFERERPLRIHDLIVETSWSFPSGHASGAVVTYGMLAWVLCQLLPRATHLPLVLCAAAIALNVGLSRVLLQVHYCSDVLAGFAIGAVWLTLCIAWALTLDRRKKAE